jgi:hypothetical protein
MGSLKALEFPIGEGKDGGVDANDGLQGHDDFSSGVTPFVLE